MKRWMDLKLDTLLNTLSPKRCADDHDTTDWLTETDCLMDWFWNWHGIAFICILDNARRMAGTISTLTNIIAYMYI